MLLDISANGTQKWNIDSAGTLRLLDSVHLRLGTGDDLRLYHDGSDSYIDNTNSTGHLYIRNTYSNSHIHLQARSGEESIFLADDGEVQLYFDNSKKVSPKTYGAEVLGTVVADNTAGRNMVINGDMRVAQRGTSASYSSSATAILACDRWFMSSNGTTGTVAQVAESPNNEFYYSLKATNTEPVGSIAAGNMFGFSY